MKKQAPPRHHQSKHRNAKPRGYLSSQTKVVGVATVVLLLGVGILCLAWYFLGGRGLAIADQQARVGALIKTGDIESCKQADSFVIEGIHYGTVCRNNIIYQEALRDDNPSACGGVDGVMMTVADCERTVIKKVMAEGKGTPEFCASQKDGETRSFCLDLEEDYGAREAKDPALCAAIMDVGMRADCRDPLLFQKLNLAPTGKTCALFPTESQSNCHTFLKTKSCLAFKNPRFQTLCAGGQ